MTIYNATLIPFLFLRVIYFSMSKCSVIYMVLCSLSLRLEAGCPVPFTKSPATKPLPTESTTTTPVTVSSTSMASTPPRPCAIDYGYSVLAIRFLNYSNPSDFKSTGIHCDSGAVVNGKADNCDLVFEICVSALNSR